MDEEKDKKNMLTELIKKKKNKKAVATTNSVFHCMHSNENTFFVNHFHSYRIISYFYY